MDGSRISRLVTIQRNPVIRYAVTYDVEWHDPIPPDLRKRASYDPADSAIPLAARLARLGAAASFFGFLRRRFPIAFVITNILEVNESERALCGSLEIEPDEILQTYPNARISWDYGWGLGGVPIRGSPAHLLEVADLALLIPGLIGWCSGQVSFVLMLAARGVGLNDLRVLIEAVERDEDWEPRVLDKVTLMGFSHEGASYSMKARQRVVLGFLDELTRGSELASRKGAGSRD